MPTRLLFALIATFWVVMNVLLWRAEFGRGRETLSTVPVETVVDRLLNAPDASVLQIRHHGQAIGLLRWIPTVSELHPARPDDAAAIPEGMVEAVGYNLDLDLNLHGELPGERWRVLLHLELNTNQVWQQLSLRLFQRPASWELTTKAGEDKVTVRYEEGKNSWEQNFSAGDLQKLGALMGPYTALLPAPLAANLRNFNPQQLGAGLRWQAQHDWLKVGRNRVRVYRVQANLFGRYEVVAYLSRAGEILRVRLPDALTFANESLPTLGRE